MSADPWWTPLANFGIADSRNRIGYRSFLSHNPIHEGVVGYSKMLGYLREASSKPKNSESANVSTRPLVIGLLSNRSPSAISGLVISVIVYSVDGEISFWSLSHVSQKVLELGPPLANGDSPTSVVGILVVVRVLTSLPHSHPRVVCRRPKHSVRPGSVANLFVRKTTATLDPTRSKVPDLINSNLSTFASTLPSHSSSSPSKGSNSRQSYKYFSGQIKSFHEPLNTCLT